MTHNTREWEAEFDEQFKGAIQLKSKPDGVTVTRLKAFIHQELQKAREGERERIEALAKDVEVFAAFGYDPITIKMIDVRDIHSELDQDNK